MDAGNLVLLKFISHLGHQAAEHRFGDDIPQLQFHPGAQLQDFGRPLGGKGGLFVIVLPRHVETDPRRGIPAGKVGADAGEPGFQAFADIGAVHQHPGGGGAEILVLAFQLLVAGGRGHQVHGTPSFPARCPRRAAGLFDGRHL